MDPGQRTREEVLVTRYRLAEQEYNSAASDIEAYFMPKLREALDAKDYAMADDLKNRCPDHVTKCVMIDQIKNYKPK